MRLPNFLSLMFISVPGSLVATHGLGACPTRLVSVDREVSFRSPFVPSECLRFKEFLHDDELTISLWDSTGHISPVRIVYRLYQVRSDGSRFQVGSQRVPVEKSVGEYYAAERAGELGQPGDWVVVWEFQKDSQTAPQLEEMAFRVSDAVMAADPNDTTVRSRKYGWK